MNSSYSQLSSNPEVDRVARGVTNVTNDHRLSNDVEMSLAKTYSLKGDDNDTLRLMHYYTISTSFSMSDSSFAALRMRNVIPALAFEHDFLLSGILAVTSLHLAILNSCPIHSNAAMKHHSEALTLTRPHLSHVTPDNVSALFSFSCLIACYSFGFHQANLSCADPIGEILEVFTLLRGIAVIVKNGAQWLEQGPFAESMLPKPSNPNASLAPKIEAAISSLSQCNSALMSDSVTQEAYAVAIEMLRQTFLLSAEQPNAKMAALPFPIMAPQGLMEKLRDRDPMALVILAYYGVVLHWLRDDIWLRGWGKEILDGVTKAVRSEWRVWLDFAVKEVEPRDFQV